MTTRGSAPARLRVLITGGAKGLGRSFAEELGRAGAFVVITGRDRQALLAARDEMRAEGIVVDAVAADSTDRAAVTSAVEHVERSAGGLDVLVNNAGLAGPIGNTWEVDDDEWWQAMEVNVRGTMLTSTAALPHMVRRGAGRIINIVSHAGVYRWPRATAYSVSKAAVIKLTENLAAETREHGVTVLSYHPGLVEAGITLSSLARAEAGGNPWEKRIAAWYEVERTAGRTTPIARAAAVLRRLAEGAADHRSGEYITVEDVLEPSRVAAAE
ncbi:SDR family NAD(P)-dependent oxidoreductase [Lentzea sp. E54]|uniref:SDR family NAD(P)-dependent oxidoreductase n=1 Tax=Lentzea xerophila TaxID=3435883 RepID=UPI003DA462CE